MTIISPQQHAKHSSCYVDVDQSSSLSYRPAVASDAVFLTQLVNSAYRGDTSRQGWTTEAGLLDGPRIETKEVLELISADDSVIFLCVQQQQIIGCVHLQKDGDAAYLGMFVVNPLLQGHGIGKQFMQAAELHAQAQWGINKMWMTVISVREELIAYYQRRGYVRTGRFKPFPKNNGKEKLLVEDLQFEEMEKTLHV
ncbi:GNAT family N-acetyltransferase [Undibacterium sp. RuRC25W]|uniref:GNAT family N-acetyltransferase n=1 Tax=Undibacterium sp. RuRC25W TaxID=3413047 RepID=UPI003BF34636